ncbi:MAG: peptidoglycan-binding domain-containing protein [Buchananella hordeovulneris]|nr:peptidoglycan-binding domain-containing protein [Buchananella hordeovulneris]
MPNLEEAVKRIVWLCEHGNLGYDQSNRRDIRVGGECDCSSLVCHGLEWGDFDIGGATYTGNMIGALTPRGWTLLPAWTTPRRGDILLDPARHVAIATSSTHMAEASIDERGEIVGGQSGDQTGWETRVAPIRRFYTVILRYTGGGSVPQEDYSTGDRWNPNGYDAAYVSGVQRMLVALGYNVGSAGVDGVLGEHTFRAIEAFQRSEGLLVDGIPGPTTRGRLQAKAAPKPKPAPAPQRRHFLDIRELQRAVRATPDGVAGPDTRKRIDAVRAASDWAGGHFPYGVAYTQQVVGTTPDGIWGPASAAAHDATVTSLQRALNAIGYRLAVDGIYGPATHAAATNALARAEQP